MPGDLRQDYLERIRDEVRTLEQELAADRVRERLAAITRQLHLPEEIALAAIYRAARRSGLSLAQFLTELERTSGSGDFDRSAVNR